MTNYSPAAWAKITRARNKQRIEMLRSEAKRFAKAANGNHRLQEVASGLHHMADLYEHHGYSQGYPNYVIPDENRPVYFRREPVASYASSPMALVAEIGGCG